MCGIVGAIAARDVLPILLDGLQRLEYRGYDSAGVAIRDADGELKRFRRSEEHTSELQSHHDLVCRLLLEKKNKEKEDRWCQ